MTDVTPSPENENNEISKSKHEVPQSTDSVVIKRTTLNYLVIAVVFFLLGLGLGGFYLNADSMATAGSVDINEQEIANIVRDLLVEAELLREYVDDMYTLVDDDPYIGDEDAPIIIVEFSAYACPYCGRHFNTTLEPLLENYGQYIRYVYRDHPIINQNVSFPASIAAYCARQQGGDDVFWEYHRTLFENQNLLGTTFFVQTAQDLELDVDAFNDCFQSDEAANEVIDDYNVGSSLNITGTPSFYINGNFHSGAQPYEYFESIVLEELEKLNIDPAQEG